MALSTNKTRKSIEQGIEDDVLIYWQDAFKELEEMNRNLQSIHRWPNQLMGLSQFAVRYNLADAEFVTYFRDATNSAIEKDANWPQTKEDFRTIKQCLIAFMIHGQHKADVFHLLGLFPYSNSPKTQQEKKIRRIRNRIFVSWRRHLKILLEKYMDLIKET